MKFNNQRIITFSVDEDYYDNVICKLFQKRINKSAFIRDAIYDRFLKLQLGENHESKGA